jgi:KipI family sensor histidine kinase inhibitor
MKLHPAGRNGLLVELDTQAQARALYAELRRRALHNLREIVPAARSVLLIGGGLDALATEIPRWPLSDTEIETGPLVEIPVVYDGPDLSQVASLSGLSETEVIRLHTGTELGVAFCGFVPGFSYLTGLPEALRVPRRKSPRTRVDPGSVGLAGEFTGIYPRASPGGWQIIGHTTLAVWDSTRHPPALLAPGTRVRFVQVSP